MAQVFERLPQFGRIGVVAAALQQSGRAEQQRLDDRDGGPLAANPFVGGLPGDLEVVLPVRPVSHGLQQHHVGGLLPVLAVRFEQLLQVAGLAGHPFEGQVGEERTALATLHSGEVVSAASLVETGYGAVVVGVHKGRVRTG